MEFAAQVLKKNPSGTNEQFKFYQNYHIYGLSLNSQIIEITGSTNQNNRAHIILLQQDHYRHNALYNIGSSFSYCKSGTVLVS